VSSLLHKEIIFLSNSHCFYYTGKRETHKKSSLDNLREREHLGGQGVDGISEWILEKQIVKMRTELGGIRTGSMVGSLWTRLRILELRKPGNSLTR
jgi:hypothetical protein